MCALCPFPPSNPAGRNAQMPPPYPPRSPSARDKYPSSVKLAHRCPFGALLDVVVICLFVCSRFFLQLLHRVWGAEFVASSQWLKRFKARFPNLEVRYSPQLRNHRMKMVGTWGCEGCCALSIFLYFNIFCDTYIRVGSAEVTTLLCCRSLSCKHAFCANSAGRRRHPIDSFRALLLLLLCARVRRCAAFFQLLMPVRFESSFTGWSYSFITTLFAYR